MSNSSNPLVSIVVITYNSSSYVIETLESIKAQTYQNIELIVSDDCSKDKTVDVCKKWIEKNKQRFVRTELITIEKNSGIASNCNRGLREANGDWIKFIGGDDIILSNGINLLVEFQSRHNYASLIHGRVIYINKGGDEIQTVSSANKLLYPTFNEEFRSNKIHAPSVFFLRSALNDVGGFNEQYKIEDIYVYLKLLSKGMLAYYTNGIIAKYRIHQNNISSDNLFMLDEHLRILSEYKKRPGFVLNYYFFCRNVLLLNLLKKNISNKNIRLIIQKNPLVFISIFDAVFWYRYMKGLGKKFLKVKYHG